ncbi:MAG: prefoldin subunit beta [Sulfolobales archaeon]
MSITEQLPPEIQQMLVRYQQTQNQLGQVLSEKNLIMTELSEINRALEVLNSINPDGIVFKSVGHVMVKVQRDEVIKELSERKEILELRLKSVEKQEQLLRSQLNELQNKVNEYLAKIYGRQAKTG